MTPLRPTSRHRRPLALAWLLAAAMLLAQGLGLVHAVRHAPGLAHPAGLASVHDHGAGPVQVAAAFGGHDGQDAASCRLYDQLTHADVLPVAALPLPADADAAARPALQPAGWLPRCQTAYSARAPPRG
ncbi:hypothetical protein ACPOLB_22110 [Rubrivivax sp. RP6-9]|uniref:hypothetical protein n=1 Tax=Rubrivivax sp. RP6-9 TaxID=3415750 RepID=UPI003CC5EA7C